jgi:DNA polymerase-3 subunit epsilon
MVVNQAVRVVRTEFVNPKCDFESFHKSLHGITPKAVENSKSFPELHSFLSSVLCKVPVYHHGEFDRQAIEQSCARFELPSITADWRNSIDIFNKVLPARAADRHDLKSLCRFFGIEHKHHDAGHDSLATARILNLAVHGSALAIPQQFLPKPINRNPIGTVVFTGDMNKMELARIAEKYGYVVGNTVTRHTTILCHGLTDRRTIESGNLISGKQKRAEALIKEGLPIKIMSEVEFRKALAE